MIRKISESARACKIKTSSLIKGANGGHLDRHTSLSGAEDLDGSIDVLVG